MNQTSDPPARAIVLIGVPGAGKSTAAREIARTTGSAFGLNVALDSDQLVEKHLGHSIAEEFAKNGEASFREHEERVVCEMLANADDESVIALGGGSVLSPRVREALRNHVVVFLELSPEIAWDRIVTSRDEWPFSPGCNPGARPLAHEREEFLKLCDERLPIYRELADATVSADADVISRALPAIIALRSLPRDSKLLWARSAAGEYPVFIGAGLLGDAKTASSSSFPLLKDVFLSSDSRSFCISDADVAPLYAQQLGELQVLSTIRPGEKSKTLAVAEELLRELLAAEMRRSDHVVALGGGVVGDLAGFCAATYQRGGPIVHVPTSLVAQIDSAYGGKNGVNLPEAKNYVGTYHQPAGVVVDPDVLQTLPPRELGAGWAELIRTALVTGGELWRRVAAREQISSQMITECAHTKLELVAEDERDTGRRQLMNLGHTVGHAVETVTHYQRYLHGEAVGLGLLAALTLSGQEELRAQVSDLLAFHGLPTHLGGESIDEICAATLRDKKRVGDKVPFVLLDNPGETRFGCEVSEAELRAAVRQLLS